MRITLIVQEQRYKQNMEALKLEIAPFSITTLSTEVSDLVSERLGVLMLTLQGSVIVYNSLFVENFALKNGVFQI